MATKLEIKDINLFFGKKQVLKDISMAFAENQVTALIGPSGSGKSTLLRCLNRMHDLVPGARVEGEIWYGDRDINRKEVDVVEVRRQLGMVFQKPNPFPKSIFENIAYGLKINNKTDNLKKVVETSLRKSAIWDEVHDRLDQSALELSGGQQQRLCIARAIAIEPDIIMMDEPCSALDPISTKKVEDLITELKKDFTIIIVTHNMQQAQRIADRTAFMYLGELKEYNHTAEIFENPQNDLTKEYVKGQFG